MTGRAVFLDRDGVLNRSFIGDDGIPRPPAGIADLEILPGVREACEELRDLGFLLVVATNQPDVARGDQRREAVEEIHRALREALPIDDIRVCYHDDVDDCDCRKPRPGLLLEAARDWTIDLAGSYMVGDRWRDIEAGRAAGCTTILVGDGAEPLRSEPTVRVESLPRAVRWIRARLAGEWEGRQ